MTSSATTANKPMSGQIALITGGGSGIGLAIATLFIAQGAKVCITGRRPELLQQAQQQLGENLTFCVGDVTYPYDRQRMVDHAKQTFGNNITILVNNAGQNIKQPAIEVTDEGFDSVLDTHVKSAFALSRMVAKDMLAAKQGSIIFLSSMAAFIGVPNVIAYTTAKTAILGLTRGLSAEWSSQGVRVNAIAPGWIHTPMTDKAFDGDPARKEKVLSRTPMARMGKVEDIANMASYICSDAANFITGQCFTVDGGAATGF